MGFVDGVLVDATGELGQYVYFKIKNKKRAKAFKAFAEEHGLAFSAKSSEYDGEIMKIQSPSAAELKSQGKKRLSRKARYASRYYGDSPFQTKLWPFVSNRMRGDWQSNCNIVEGNWKGHLMTSFDTLWFSYGESNSEGEYTSVFAHCHAQMPQVIITPTGILSSLKRADEGQILNLGYHHQKFESNEFNKAWRVSAIDQRIASDFISQKMMDYLMDHQNEKWHIELSPGGILISTVLTLNMKKVEAAMNMLAGFLEHIDADLLQHSSP